MAIFLKYSWRKGLCLTSPDEELRASITIWAMGKGSVSTVEFSSVSRVIVRMIGSGTMNGWLVAIFQYTQGERVDI